jgi:hypothetical protein
MPAKRKTTSTPTKRHRGARTTALYPSLAQGLTSAQRRVELELRMRLRGIQPIADFDRYLEEVSDFWPEDESCDEFLAWLRRLRREV